MNITELYSAWMSKTELNIAHRSSEQINVEPIAELCLYNHIDHPEKDAVIMNTVEIKEALEAFEAQGHKTLLVHYGHYFNAEYEKILTLIGFIKRRFSGELYALSPEEIVFLSIRGSKTVEQVVEALKTEGIDRVWGFLPTSIMVSKYYSEEDELFIDDRHHVLDALNSAQITYQYPFNLGQIDFIEEFSDMVNYINANQIKTVVLQPNALIDTEDVFDYLHGQEIFLSLFPNGHVPAEMIEDQSSIKTVNGGYKYKTIIGL